LKSPDADFKSYNIIVWGIVIIFAVVFVALALNRHAAFETNGFDLGNVNQAIWNTAHGRLLAFTNMAPLTNRLALHVEPILFLFVPFYWLGLGGPKLLLATQAIVVALGAWPLYLIARSKIGPIGAAIASAAYLLYPALEAAVMFDFHAVTLAPTFLLFAFYFMEQWLEPNSKELAVPKKEGQTLSRQRSALSFVLFAALAMATKEDMGFMVGLMGAYIGLRCRRWKPALVILAIGWGWSLTAIFLIQPMFAAGGNIQGDRYAWLAEALTNPQLLWAHFQQVNLPDYFWRLLAPVAGLSLLSPLALLPTLPSLAINLLSSHPLTWRLEAFHYAAPIAPFVFIAAMQGIARIAGEQGSRGDKGTRRQGDKGRTTHHASRTTHYALRTTLIALLLLTSLTYHLFRGFTPLARPFNWRPMTAHQQLGAEMAARIDSSLPLFAPLNLNPRVSSRAVLHQDFDDIAPDDWLWLDVSTLPNENGVQQRIRDDLLPRYRTTWAEDGYLILQPNHNSQFVIHNSQFLSFALAGEEEKPQYSVDVNFGDSLRLVGYDIHFNRAETEQVTTYWQAQQQLPSEASPVLFLADADGALQGETTARDLSPTLIWFPVERWPAGQTLKVTFNKLN